MHALISLPHRHIIKPPTQFTFILAAIEAGQLGEEFGWITKLRKESRIRIVLLFKYMFS